MPIPDDVIECDHCRSQPTSHEAIIRNDETVLVTATRSRNALPDPEWEVRGYDVTAADVFFTGLDSSRRTELAVALIENLGGDALSRPDADEHRPLKHGVPVDVATDSPASVAAYLYVRGWGEAEIADALGVGSRTVTEYFSRVRRQADGLPNDIDGHPLPEPGDIMPTVPPAMDPTADVDAEDADAPEPEA